MRFVEWSMDFVVDVYKIIRPVSEGKKFGLTSQIRRATVSIPANIAEGAARKSPKDYRRFMSNA